LAQIVASPGGPQADEIDGAGNRGVVHDVAAAEGRPIHRDVAQPGGGGLSLDQLAVLHQHELEIAEPVLLGDVQRRRFGVRGHAAQHGRPSTTMPAATRCRMRIPHGLSL